MNDHDNTIPSKDPNVGAIDIDWQWSSFDELSRDDLYRAMQLRQQVFVVEQTCPYLDADGYDRKAWHLLGYVAREQSRELAAYARVFPPGIKYGELSIGRVVTSSRFRRTGLGRRLMAEAIRRCESLHPGEAIRISAQLYLEAFYFDLGFRRTTDPYDEDGIEHVEMLRSPT